MLRGLVRGIVSSGSATRYDESALECCVSDVVKPGTPTSPVGALAVLFHSPLPSVPYDPKADCDVVLRVPLSLMDPVYRGGTTGCSGPNSRRPFGLRGGNGRVSGVPAARRRLAAFVNRSSCTR